MLERTPTQLLAAMANAALLAILFLPASAEAQTTGTIKASDGATLELVEDDDAKDSDATTGAEKKAEPAAELTLPAGTHTVIYRRDGYYPIKGQVTVTAGGSSTISAAAEKVPERKELEAWSVLSLTAGSAALLTAFVLELSGEEESGDRPDGVGRRDPQMGPHRAHFAGSTRRHLPAVRGTAAGRRLPLCERKLLTSSERSIGYSGGVPTALLITLVLSSAVPTGLPPNLSVRIDTAPDLRCPSERRVIQQLAREMTVVPMYLPARRSVLVSVYRQPGRVVADIVVRDGEGALIGRRTIEGRRCRAVMESVVLSLTVALQQVDRGPPVDLRRGPELTATPRLERRARTRVAIVDDSVRYPAGPSVRIARVGLAPARNDGPVVGLALSGFVAAGPVPAPSWGGRAAVELRWPRGSLAFEGQADTGSATMGQGTTIRSTRAFGAVVPCGHFSVLGLCVVAGAGAVAHTGGTTDETRATIMAGARLTAQWDLSRTFALRAFVEGIATTVQFEEKREGTNELLYSTAPITMSFGLAAVSSF